jgi:predicted regulator of Ras-like GTPase activity (Roadblock/LC7/MglB family)
MDAKQALTDLTEISSQIRSAVLLDESGSVTASTLEDERAKRMGEAVKELVAAAERTRPGLGPGALKQLEVATLEGSVFIVRDRGRVIAATTSSEPTVGLVFYDLKTCLRNATEGDEKSERPTAATEEPATEQAATAEPAAEPAAGRGTAKEDDGEA